MKRVAVTGYGSQFCTLHNSAEQLELCRDFLPTFSGPLLAEVKKQALRAGWGTWKEPSLGPLPEDIGVVFGSSKGDLRRLIAGDPPNIEGPWFGWPDHFAADLARGLGAQGPVLAPVAACATGTHCLALGAQLIQDGRAKAVVVGAWENSLLEPIMACYRNMGALSRGGVVRPFDRDRDGFLPGEGLGFLLLEAEEEVAKRGAIAVGYLTGWSLWCDATHMTSMDVSGARIAKAIENALCRAGLSSLDYINAHGTATRLNDVAESRGIRSVLGQATPVSSTKPLTRHLLGAAGAVESVICLQALATGHLPPTLNLQNADVACDLDYIPLVGCHLQIQSCLNLNYGFGGHIGALIFQKS